jgi:hypothetical protein
MAREPREVWEKRVARWRESGLTAKEFAGEVGVNANTLAHWAWRLDQAGAGPAQGAAQSSSKPKPPAVPFVEVVPAAVADAVKAPDALELVLIGGRTVRVPADFDSEALRRLIAVAERR